MDSKAAFLLLLCGLASLSVEAKGPFSSVNSGELGDYIVEYGADYRTVALASQTGNFQLVFFNTTPNAFAVAVRMGNFNRAETMRFVWTANRNDLVGDNATLSFASDGNLVLADADGRLVWSTNTSNKGAVGIELRNDGNLVLYDASNRSVWQSFDHPTDTLLVGQSLGIGGVSKLVSRLSDRDGSEGPYTLVMEAGGLALYFNGVPYWTLSFYASELKDLFSITHTCKRAVATITFLSDPDAENGYRQMLEMRLGNSTAPPERRAAALCNLTSDGISTALYSFTTPRFSTTLSFVRLDSDGNLRMYTYSPQIEYNTWDITYERFKCGGTGIYGCGLPRKCGSFGLCEKSQCVACPQPGGLLGWSDQCSPPVLPNCGTTPASHVDFYEVVGAEHFSSKYAAAIGNVKMEECRRRCLGDCKCAAFFYWEESSKCFLTQSLDTLQQLGNTKHLAFIKTQTKM
uniref:Bulb-type lectin domain-containing protein n=1 Tax=Araucaria cunninghamii TaxID=56994 RepID=A0A0D6R4V4_ARACU